MFVKSNPTDKNGVVSFLPERPGKWTIKVIAESDHDRHAANVEIVVKEDLLMESFSKPLVASHAKFFVGGGLLLGAFGIWELWKRADGLRVPGSMQRPVDFASSLSEHAAERRNLPGSNSLKAWAAEIVVLFTVFPGNWPTLRKYF
jgi:hypothetical protein